MSTTSAASSGWWQRWRRHRNLPVNDDEVRDADNLVELAALERMIRRSEGFRIAFAVVNHPALRNRVIRAVRRDLPDLTIAELTVPDTPTGIVAKIETAARPPPGAVFVVGLDELGSDQVRSRVIAELNLNRDHPWRAAPVPVVLWASDFAIRQFAAQATDLWSGRSGLYRFRAEGDDNASAIGDIVSGINWGSTPDERREREALLHDLLDESGDDPKNRARLLAALVSWATSTASTDPCNPARRLTAVRGFLRQLSALDGATEVPPPGLLGPTGHRTPPHVYSDREIGDLLRAAAGLSPAGGLRPHCYATLFGLLACTGLRISEALALLCADVDLAGGMLTVRAGKRGRSRLVPLHPSALPPLRDYAADRARRYGPPGQGEVFFRTDRSDRVSYNAANQTFLVLRRQLGWTAAGRTRPPRVHDLRHRMVVRRIQAWHAHDVDVDAKIAVLVTYLGHVEVRDVYWYLSAVPELMSIVADRFEAFTGCPPAGVS